MSNDKPDLKNTIFKQMEYAFSLRTNPEATASGERTRAFAAVKHTMDLAVSLGEDEDEVQKWVQEAWNTYKK